MSPLPIASADSLTAANSQSTNSDSKADAAADAAVKTAATALEKEFAAHLANAKTPLRTKSDFFAENKDPAVTTKAIVAAMNRTYGSTASTVYVRWQLLSGVKDTVDDALTPALLSAYQAAPIPPERPGLDPSQKAQFTQIVAQMAESDEAKINTEFEQHVQDWDAAIKPFTDYRDELAKRLAIKLSSNFDFVQAEFRDGVQRATAGVDADIVMKTAMEHGKDWALGNGTPIQIAQLSSEVKSLLQEMGATAAQINAGTAVGSADAPSPSTAFAQADLNTTETDGYLAPKAPAKTGTAGSSKGATKAAEPAFPPRFLTEVAWNDKSHSLQWKTGSAKFATKAELIEFRKAIEEQPSGIKSKNTKGTNQQDAN